MQPVAEVRQLDQEVSESDGTERHVSLELPVLEALLGVLSLVLQHSIVEEHPVHVPDEAGLVELELRGDVEAAGRNLSALREDLFGFIMLQLHQREVLGVAEVESDCRFEALNVDVLWKAARVGQRVGKGELVVQGL